MSTPHGEQTSSIAMNRQRNSREEPAIVFSDRTWIEFTPEGKAGHIAAYLRKGSDHFSEGNYNKAIAEYTRVLELEPEHIKALHNRGVCYCRKIDYERAIRDFTKVLQCEPNDLMAVRDRGVCFLRKGDIDAAIDDLTQAIVLDRRRNKDAQRDSSIPFARAECYIQQDGPNKALADLTESINLNESTEALYLRGMVYEKYEKDIFKAKDDCERLLFLDPDHIGGKDLLKRCEEWERTKYIEEELSKIEVMLKTYRQAKNPAVGLYDEGMAKIESGDFKGAIEAFNTSLQLDKSFALSFMGRAKAYQSQSLYEKATQDFETATKYALTAPLAKIYLGDLGAIVARIEKEKKDAQDRMASRNSMQSPTRPRKAGMSQVKMPSVPAEWPGDNPPSPARKWRESSASPY